MSNLHSQSKYSQMEKTLLLSTSQHSNTPLCSFYRRENSFVRVEIGLS